MIQLYSAVRFVICFFGWREKEKEKCPSRIQFCFVPIHVVFKSILLFKTLTADSNLITSINNNVTISP